MSSILPSDDFYLPRRRRSLAPILIGAAVAVITLAGRSKVGQWLRGFFSPSFSPYDDVLPQQLAVSQLTLPQLRRSLLGQSMATVVNSLGPPRTVSNGEPKASVTTLSHAADAGPGAFWHSDTWYYAVDSARHTAMAIRFTAGVAQQVDFFDLPESIEA